MVIPDGKNEDCLSLAIQSDADADAGETSTRKGGLSEEPETFSTVIVDMREFRSELPAILYTRGIKVEPITLQV